MSDAAVARISSPPEQRERGEVTVLPGQTPEGGHILGVLLKRTYDIIRDGRASRAAVDGCLIPGDRPWGNPLNTTTRHESDFVPFKLDTDVVFDALAYAPGGVPTETVTVGVRIAGRQKLLWVTGDRVARYGEGETITFTHPVPFQTMEMRYERAYGGIDVFSNKEMPCPDPRNPLGRGFAVARRADVVDGLELPNIEDPADLLTPERLCAGEYANWPNQPKPAGLGWASKTSLPRASLAGVLPADRPLEQELRQAFSQLLPLAQRAPYLAHPLPAMDFRFFNGASDGLALPYLVGDERIETANLSPDGRFAFFLPGERPEIAIDIGAGLESLLTVIHTVVVRMEERQVDIVWRGAQPYPGRDWLPALRRLDVHVG